MWPAFWKYESISRLPRNPEFLPETDECRIERFLLFLSGFRNFRSWYPETKDWFLWGPGWSGGVFYYAHNPVNYWWNRSETPIGGLLCISVYLSANMGAEDEGCLRWWILYRLALLYLFPGRDWSKRFRQHRRHDGRRQCNPSFSFLSFPETRCNGVRGLPFLH